MHSQHLFMQVLITYTYLGRQAGVMSTQTGHASAEPNKRHSGAHKGTPIAYQGA
jgi:hypothetical protein